MIKHTVDSVEYRVLLLDVEATTALPMELPLSNEAFCNHPSDPRPR